MSDDKILDTRSERHRCLQSLIEVFLYIDGQLDDERASDIDEHLKYCKKCYGRIEFEKLVKGYIKRRSTKETASGTVVESVTKMLDNA